MPVQDSTHRVGDRLVMVVTFDENGEEGCNVAARPGGALGAGAGAFEQPWQFGEDAGRVTASRRRLAGR